MTLNIRVKKSIAALSVVAASLYGHGVFAQVTIEYNFSGENSDLAENRLAENRYSAAKWFGPNFPHYEVRDGDADSSFDKKLNFLQNYVSTERYGRIEMRSDKDEEKTIDYYDRMSNLFRIIKERSESYKRNLTEQEYELELISKQLSGGGLGKLVLAMALFKDEPQDAVKPLPPLNDDRWKLQWNKLTLDLDTDGSAIIEAETEKTCNDANKLYSDEYTCEYVDENGHPKGFSYQFKWRIHVAPNGLGRYKTEHKTHPYKYIATGDDISIEYFQIKFPNNPYVDVKLFDPKSGKISPFYDVLIPSANDCIDITSKVELNFGINEIMSISPADLNFCAGSCSGYLLAATNN